MTSFNYVIKALVHSQLFWQQWLKSLYSLVTVAGLILMPVVLIGCDNPLIFPCLLFSTTILAVILPMEGNVLSDHQNGWLTWYLANFDDAYGYFSAKLIATFIYQLLPLLGGVALILPLLGLSLTSSLTLLQAIMAITIIVVAWGNLLLLILCNTSLAGKSVLTLFLLLPFLVPGILITYQQFYDMIFDGQFHYYGYQWGLVLVTIASTTALAPLALRQSSEG